MRFSTSPSVYLEIVGTAAVADSCAPLGAVHTNSIVAVPPGGLMTYSPLVHLTVGEEVLDPNGVIGEPFIGYQKSLNLAELDCPTFGLGRTTGANGRVYQTFGPPYLPAIIPPREILSLDPAWLKYCRNYVSHGPGLRSFAIFDPPRVLTPVAALLPPSTLAPATVSAIRTADPVLTKESQIHPASTTSPSIPLATVTPIGPDLPFAGRKSSLPVIAGDSQPIEVETAGSKLPQLPALLATAPVDPQLSSSVQPALSPNQPSLNHIAGPAEDPQNLGAIIYSVFNGGDPLPGKSANQASTLPVLRTAHALTADGPKATFIDPSEFVVGENTYSAGGPAVTLSNGVLSIIPPAESGKNVHFMVNPSTPRILTIAGQTFTANPSGIAIAGTTLLPGGPGITISGTPITLGPSGTLFVGDNPVPLANELYFPPSFVFMIGGQTATANPAGFVLADSKLLPGGTPITISGTPVSLDPSGVLFIGSSSINLLAPTSSQNTFTVGGYTFIAESTGFKLAGSTLLPGGAAITISGTPISLAPSGVLIIGSSSIDLPAKSSVSDVFTTNGLTFTAEPSAIVVDGITLVPGGPAITVLGTPISLRAGNGAGVLIIGTSTINLPAHTLRSNLLTAGGLTFTSEPSALIVDGTTLLPGGPGATISGTPISLIAGEDSEILIIGTSTINLPTHASVPSILNVAGLTFTAQPSGVAVNGFTLAPGGSGITVSGTPVSLEPGGSSLVVGSREVPLATRSPTTGGSVTLLGFEGGEARSAGTPDFWHVAGLLGVTCMVFTLG